MMQRTREKCIKDFIDEFGAPKLTRLEENRNLIGYWQLNNEVMRIRANILGEFHPADATYISRKEYEALGEVFK